MRSYGAELELADIDRTKQLPEGFGWDIKDYSMVNSNGIAVDPKGILYNKGGEIQTKPTYSIKEQVENFEMIMAMFPEAVVNYRSNLHIHVRIPGLKDDLEKLKSLQRFIHEYLKPVIHKLEPITEPKNISLKFSELEGMVKRTKRRKKSHQTFLSKKRLEAQLQAKTVKEFFELEVPKTAEGVVMWHAQARVCVNLRQLRETDTIEFRHFPGTVNSDEFCAALLWCDNFLNMWEMYYPFDEFVEEVEKAAPYLPKFKDYNHQQELRYRRTTHDGSVKKEDIKKAIQEIEEEIKNEQ